MSAACGRRIPSPTPQPGREKPPPRENNGSAASSEEGGAPWGKDTEKHTCFEVCEVQGEVETTAEDAPAAGGPPGSPHRLTVQGVGLQTAPRVHGIPHLQGKHSTRYHEQDPNLRGSAGPLCTGGKRSRSGTRLPIFDHPNSI